MNSVEWASDPGYYGGDLTHAMSAWTSTARELTEEKAGRVDKLLKFLAENKHTTPFEKSFLHFLVTADTASHIHLIKHRIGVSINGESARYKELKDDKYHVPEDWPEDLQYELHVHMQNSYYRYHYTIEKLVEQGIDRKRAKESARFFLPYANQITLDVSFNFHSFMHFAELRYDDHAQLEIREIAGKMIELVRETGKFTHSLSAYGY